MTKGFKRRKYFIKKRFQGKLILSTFLFVCGGCLLFIVFLGLFSSTPFTISDYNGIHVGQTPLIVAKQILLDNWQLIAIGGAILVISSILLSHRVAGPLYRFEKALDHMNLGHLDTAVHLRSSDEGQELAEKITLFNNSLSQSMRTIKNNTAALELLLEQTAALDLHEEQKEVIAGLCWSMQEHNRKIQNTCSTYILKN